MRIESGLAYLTAEEMRNMDGLASKEEGVSILSLMENAGKAGAEIARLLMGQKTEAKAVAVLVGKGNKGGDGLVSARHLAAAGASVTLVLATDPDSLGELPALQLRLLSPMKLHTVKSIPKDSRFDLMVDALLGYGVRGAPREPIAHLIREANDSGVPVLSLDLPSGLDPNTGEVFDSCIEAAATVTFALPKTGFLGASARSRLGSLYLADIGIPAKVYSRVTGLDPPFKEGPIVQII